MQLDLREAAQYSYDHYLHKPFTANTLYNRLGLAVKLHTPLGVLQRPNHGMAHTLRTMNYIPYILEYYKKNGLTDADGQPLLAFDEIHEDDILRLQMAMAFYVTGRESEDCFANNPKLYDEYRVKSAENFERYVREKDLVGPNQIFTSEAELKEYKHMVYVGFGGLTDHEPKGVKAHLWGSKGHVLNILLANAHSLDIARCRNNHDFRGNTIEWYASMYSRNIYSRDIESLVLYAQNCLVATGDKVRAKFDAVNMSTPTADGAEHTIRPLNGGLQDSKFKPNFSDVMSFVYKVPYNRRRFYECSTNVDRCIQAIESAPKPKFMSGDLANHQVTDEQAVRCARSGFAVMRLVEANLKDEGVRWDFEQIADPKTMRPVLFSKKKTVSDSRRRWIRDLFKPGRSYHRDYHEAVAPGAMLQPDHGTDYDSYHDENHDLIAHKISPPGLRGQKKNTPYTKKSSWSFLPSHGRVKHYQYRGILNFLRSIFQIQYKVGILADYRQMHHKGDRYNFSGDVATTGDINGYFWLGKSKPAHVRKSQKDINKVFYPARNNPLRFEQLKEKMENAPGIPEQSEMLIGAQTSALKGLFVTKGTQRKILELKDVSNRLKADYGISLPLLVIDGKGNVKTIQDHDVKSSLGKWNKRFFHSNVIVRFFWGVIFGSLKQVVTRINYVEKREKEVEDLRSAHGRSDLVDDRNKSETLSKLSLDEEVSSTHTAHYASLRRQTGSHAQTIHESAPTLRRTQSAIQLR